MNTKRFPLCDVLSISNGRLCGKMDGVYKILNWMTNDELFTHQLPRAMRECQPFLLLRFHDLQYANTGAANNTLDKLIADHSGDPSQGVA